MYLSSSTKEKIIDVRDYYDKRKQIADAAFLNEVLHLIQKDEKFADSFGYELTGNKMV